jgi:hypothetical protein
MQKVSNIAALVGSFRFKVFLTLLVASQMSFLVTTPANAGHIRSNQQRRKDVIECWKPSLRRKNPIKTILQVPRRVPVVQFAKNMGCTQWQMLKELYTPPAVGRLRSGCDPEQARAMGFKPERGDCK